MGCVGNKNKREKIGRLKRTPFRHETSLRNKQLELDARDAQTARGNHNWFYLVETTNRHITSRLEDIVKRKCDDHRQALDSLRTKHDKLCEDFKLRQAPSPMPTSS